MQKLSDILKLAENEATPMGLAVVETKFSQQGKRRTLEITICRKGGRVSLTDCEELSRRLDKSLDEQVPPLIEGSYMLEVQSPGLDRVLKTERDFAIFEGEEVEIKTKESIAGLGDTFTGKLSCLEAGLLNILSPRLLEQTVKNTRNKKSKSKTAIMENPPRELMLELNKILQVRLHPPAPTKSEEPLEPCFEEDSLA